jgi:hypothetical protein
MTVASRHMHRSAADLRSPATTTADRGVNRVHRFPLRGRSEARAGARTPWALLVGPEVPTR